MPYEPHPSAGTLPPDDTIIWRFMSLAKFLSFLTKSSIYFCQGTKLRDSDPYEGTLSRINLAFYKLMTTNEEFARQMMRVPPHEPLPFNYRDVFSPDKQKLFGDIFASTTYVNCWNICKHESAFFWSTYASASDGVGIRSNIGRLRKSIENEKRAIYIGPVIYIDYDSDPISEDNKLNPFFRKRKSFEAERELRACFVDVVPGVGWSERALTVNPRGHYIQCDTHALVDEVFVSPAAPQWYADVVVEVGLKFGARFPIRKSPLSDPAIF
jgi:hypothetical protein